LVLETRVGVSRGKSTHKLLADLHNPPDLTPTDCKMYTMSDGTIFRKTHDIPDNSIYKGWRGDCSIQRVQMKTDIQTDAMNIMHQYYYSVPNGINEEKLRMYAGTDKGSRDVVCDIK